jgi:histone deacetylase 8
MHYFGALSGLWSRIPMISPTLADREELLAYHSEEYLKCVTGSYALLYILTSCSTLSEVSKAKSSEDSDSESESEDLRARVTEAGLVGECAPWPGLWKWCRALAGGVLGAVDVLRAPRQVHTALYWLGGRHHAQKDEAAGFCYINDAVLGASIYSSRHADT